MMPAIRNILSIIGLLFLLAPQQADGGTQVIAWGYGASGETNVPPELTNVVAIRATKGFALALNADGRVRAWGSGPGTNVPAGLSNVVTISAGVGHALALRTDRTVVRWRMNDSGIPYTVPFFSNSIGIAAGPLHVDLALRADGIVVPWASPDIFGLDKVPEGLAGVVKVASGPYHNLVLKGDGTSLGWGRWPQANVPEGLSGVIDIAVGYSHSLALKRDGTVFAWGEPAGVIDVPAGLANVIAITTGLDAGFAHSLALHRDGTVVGWGDNTYGQARPPPGVGGIIDVAAGESYSLALVGTGAPRLVVMSSGRNIVAAGDGALLHVAALGEPPLSLQWRFNGQDIPGATSPFLLLTNVQAVHEGGYSLFASNAAGTALSEVLTLSIAPSIVPASLLRAEVLMNPVELSVSALGSAPLAYQWSFKGVPIADATNNILRIETLRYTNAGEYSVTVSNRFGVARGTNAILSVLALAGWGRNDFGEVTPPSGLSNVLAVGTLYGYGAALKSDGSIRLWGANWSPAGSPLRDSNIVAMAVGQQLVALKRDGTVVSWDGQTRLLVPGLTNIVAIASAGQNLALRSDGTVVTWAPRFAGFESVAPGLSNVVDITSGRYHALALKADGTVVTWGDMDWGHLSVPDNLSNVVAISAVNARSLALRSDGTVVTWGRGTEGPTPVPPGLADVESIDAGDTHNVALRRDGTITAWGREYYGEITGPPQVKNVAAVTAFDHQSMALFWDGPLTVWPINSPTAVTFSGRPLVLRVVAIGQSPWLGYQWQYNGTNIPGANQRYLFLDQIQAVDAAKYGVVVSSPATGETNAVNFSLAVSNTPPFVVVQPQDQLTNVTRNVEFTVQADGARPLFYQWYFQGALIPGATSSTLTVSNLHLGQAGSYTVAVSNEFGLTLSSHATLSLCPGVGWGLSTRPPPESPYYQGQNEVPVTLTNVVAFAGGASHSLALRRDGTVMSWGFPLVMPELTNVVSIAAKYDYNLALTDDGRIHQWGFSGQTITNFPAQLTDAIAIEAGAGYGLALTRDGKVVAWGGVFNEQLKVPPGLTNAIAIAAGGQCALALRADGRVACWGNFVVTNQANVYNAISNAVAVAAGSSHALALKNDGTVVAWGSNSRGQSDVPPDLTNVVALAAGGEFSLALQQDGQIRAWGDNRFGQWSVPAGLTNVATFTAGFGHVLALTHGPKPEFWSRSPSSRTVFSGQVVRLYAQALGTPPLDYQWNIQGDGEVDLQGVHGPFLSFRPTLGGQDFVCELAVSNRHGITNATFTLTVVDSPPIVITSPAHQDTNFGGTARFTVQADGSWPLSYQWLHNGRVIPGATNTLLTLTNLTPSQRGEYAALISNAWGTVLSPAAQLRVSPVVVWGQPSLQNPPLAADDAVGIAAGLNQVVAVKRDKTLVGWGPGPVLPPGLSNAVEVALGFSQSLALKNDGTLVTWGSEGTNLPAGLRDIVAVTSGERHAVALTFDGTVRSWGAPAAATNAPSGLTNVLGVSASRGYTLALRDDGQVVAWGAAGSPTNVPVGLTNVATVAAASTFACAVKSNGSVVAWSPSGPMSLPFSVTNIAAISGGSFGHALALKADGSVTAFGAFPLGGPVPGGLTNVVSVAAGGGHNVALVSAGPPLIWDVSSFGTNLASSAPLRLQARVMGLAPLQYQWQAHGTNIPGATNAVLFLARTQVGDSGAYKLVVSNALGQAAQDIAVSVIDRSPRFVRHPRSQETNVYLQASFDALADGSSPLGYQWYFEGKPLPGATEPSLYLPKVRLSDAGKYAVLATNAFGATFSSNAILSVRPIFAWGFFDWQTNLLPGLTQVVAVAAGETHSLALRPDGTVVAWGSGIWDATNVPPGLTNVVSIAAGGDTSFALRSDGRVVAWGDVRGLPAGLFQVASIAAGNRHHLAVKTDGTVIAWGDNTYGQTDVPAGLRDVVEVAPGYLHSLALRRDGTAVAWGYDGLGLNTVPPGLSNIVSVAAGAAHSLVLLANGTVVAWGDSDQTNVPPNLTSVIAIAANGGYGMALRADGTLAYWGTPSSPTTLGLPLGLTNIAALAAGGSHCLALIEDPRASPRLVEPRLHLRLFRVAVAATQGRAYSLEFTDSLSQALWRPVTTVQGFNGIMTLADTNVVSAQGYYRLRRQ